MKVKVGDGRGDVKSIFGDIFGVVVRYDVERCEWTLIGLGGDSWAECRFL